MVIVADQRATFGHAIADGEGEFDLAQELRHLFVHGRATHDHLTEATTQRIHQFLTDLGIDAAVQQRDVQGQTHHPTV